MGSDLINIKDKYGEKMMHLCRKLFPTILEENGRLFELMSSHFPFSRYLYDDIVNNSLENNFKNYINSLIFNDKEVLIETDKSPYQLLDEAGYQLYECKCEEDIQSFKKYYANEEALCSFRGDRLDTCYVFFAVKKNVDEIKREDFNYPMRQDLYGTSVISIQFTKGDINTLSIKNRYNHTVSNPDATFSNRLENIIPGLTYSFEKYYNLVINQNDNSSFEIPGYVRTKSGKYYKYNYEINNIYYCSDNIIIEDFQVVDKYQEKEKYIIMDYFIIDLVNKKIDLYDSMISDSFLDGLDNIKKIYITKDKDTKNRMIDITLNNNGKVYIEINKYNRIIGYKNDNIEMIWDNFLSKNMCLKNIEIPNVRKIGNGFLRSNVCLEEISFNKLISVGKGFIYNNKFISNVELPKLVKVGVGFLSNNERIINLSMMSLECASDDFLKKNKNLESILMPNLSLVRDGFLKYNKGLKEIDLPCLSYVGDNFLVANKNIIKVNLPYLIQVGDNFMYSNRLVDTIDFKYLQYVGDNFMHSNRCLNEVMLPRLEKVGCRFLYMNNSILRLDLPELIDVSNNFMYNNNSLREILLPNLICVGNNFLRNNMVLENVLIGNFCLQDNMFSDNVKKKILCK